MRKYSLLLILFVWSAYQVNAQQDPMFTKYMFNPMQYNPAYAGSADALDMTLLHRHQWWGIKGAPMTQSFSIHSPIPVKNVSVGFQATHDQVGVSRTVDLNAVFAYRVPLTDVTKKNPIYMSMALQGGVANFSANWENLNFDDVNDPAFQNLRPNLWLPNFGAGLYFHSQTWYVGLSAPKLITNKLRKRYSNEPTSMPIAQQYRHYYLTAGGAIKITPTVVFRPSLLIKNVGLFVEKNPQNIVGAPTEFDIDLGFMFNNFFWIGASFRSSFEWLAGGKSSYDSVDLWLGMRFKNGLRVGLAYDYTLTQLQGPGQGSYEIMLGYDMYRPSIDKVQHVRYF